MTSSRIKPLSSESPLSLLSYRITHFSLSTLENQLINSREVLDKSEVPIKGSYINWFRMTTLGPNSQPVHRDTNILDITT